MNKVIRIALLVTLGLGFTIAADKVNATQPAGTRYELTQCAGVALGMGDPVLFEVVANLLENGPTGKELRTITLIDNQADSPMTRQTQIKYINTYNACNEILRGIVN